MKRYLISTGAVLVVLFVAWTTFAQEQERSRQSENMRQRIQNMSEEEREQLRAQMRERFGGRFGIGGREEQLKAIQAIEEQVTKLKAVIAGIEPEDRSRWRELSEEERAKLIEKSAKARIEQQKAIRMIEQQLAKLKSPRQRRAEQQIQVGELRTIRDLAIKEKATQTAARLERLIARYQDELRNTRTREPRQRPERLERPPRPERDVDQNSRPGRRAPSMELNSFDGKTIRLSDYRGKIVVLEWMNFECPFSRYHYETKNTMVELANKYKNKNVVWLAINSTNHTTPQANKTFASKHKLPYAILDDRSGKVGRAYGAETTPHMYIINTRGRIVYEGAIDNSPMGQNKEGVVNYIDKALGDLTAYKEVSMVKTKPYGCTVKYAQ